MATATADDRCADIHPDASAVFAGPAEQVWFIGSSFSVALVFMFLSAIFAFWIAPSYAAVQNLPAQWRTQAAALLLFISICWAWVWVRWWWVG